jgi:hypothetical protein
MLIETDGLENAHDRRSWFDTSGLGLYDGC